MENFIKKNIEDGHDLDINESLELCGGITFYKITRTLNEIFRRILKIKLKLKLTRIKKLKTQWTRYKISRETNVLDKNWVY